MGAIWFRLRTELRARWRGLVAVALLAGAAGGVTLAAIAGARRTDTAYPRLAVANKVYDVLVNPNDTLPASFEHDLRRLPQINQIGRVDGVAVAVSPLRTPADFQIAVNGTITLASNDGAIFGFSRPKVTEGRLPNPANPDDIFVDTTFAQRTHARLGDRIHGYGISGTDADVAFSLSPAKVVAKVQAHELGIPITFHVVGIGVLPDQIVYDQGFRNGSVLLTPAFRSAHPTVAVGYDAFVVRLRGGAAAIPTFRRAVERLAPGTAIAFQTEPVTAAKFDRAVQPYVGALTIFAIVVAVTGLLLVGQAISRQSFLASADAPTLSALGVSRAQLLGLGMLRAAIVAIGATALSVVVAFACSPLLPLGPARTAEPDSGLSFDGFVVGVGAVAVLAAVLLLAALPTWRAARRTSFVDEDTTVRPSRVARALAGAGAPVTVVAGVRMGLESGRGRTAVPVRTTIITLGLALTVVLGASGVAASINHLVDTPRLYGWNWDIQVNVSKGDHQADVRVRRELEAMLDRSPAVRGWSTLSISDVRLARGAVPALGIAHANGTVGPTLVSGRLPRTDREIALGARTLSALDASVGSTVTARDNKGRSRPLVVVGRVVLPGAGTYPGADKTALGEGAVVTEHALQGLGRNFGQHDYILRYAAGSSVTEHRQLIRRMSSIVHATGDSDNFEVSTALRPSDVLSYEGVRSTPVVLALVLALLALASVAHALVTGVRRRRRDLALLSTLGFTRRQVSATVGWQATTVAISALLIGVPLGIVLGRASWTVLADNLGTVAEPVVPALVVLLAIPVVLVVVNLVAFVPARIASRLRPATVLRSE